MQGCDVTMKKQMSDSLLLAVFLTLAGGFQDAYSYNCRGQVFANAQTGNIVLLGQNLATGHFDKAFHYFMPLFAFVFGVYLAEWIRRKYQHSLRIHWRQTVLLAEIVLLIVVGWFSSDWNIWANVLLSFACAMQVNTFRKFRGLPCATTMCIGNMRSAASLLCAYHVTKDPEMRRKSLHYYFVIAIFALGAAFGAVLSQRIGTKAIWIAAGLQLIGFCLMFFHSPDTDDQTLSPF